LNIAHKKTTTLKCKVRINHCKFVSGNHVPCYLGFWVQYQSGSIKNHKHWFCPYDLNRCIDGTLQKFVIVRHTVPTIWPIQEGIYLTQNEFITLKEAGFSFYCLCKSNVRSLFGSQSSCSSNSHVPVGVSCPSVVRPSNVNCWPTTHGGKKVKQPLVLKLK
jgi:hypothetical protein